MASNERRRIAKVLLVLTFAWGLCFAIGALAGVGYADEGSSISKYRQLSGTVTFSFSHDDLFLESDGTIPGVYMAAIPVELSEVCKVDLDDYGLSKYKRPGPDGADYDFECTLMQLLVYMAQRYYCNGANDIRVAGAAGSAYLTQYWGSGENLMYYVNGQFPYDEERQQGATADAIVLADGNDVAVMRYSDYSFLDDPVAGFHFFTNDEGDVVRTLSAMPGQEVSLLLQRAWGNIYAGEPAVYCPEIGWPLYWGSYPGIAGGGECSGSVVTDKAGRASISFDASGTYCVWADGGKGALLNNSAVNSPTLVRVVVNEPQEENADTNSGSSIGLTPTTKPPLVVAPAKPLQSAKPAATSSISGAKISSIANKTYAGKAFTPKPTVKLGNATLTLGKDYAFSYRNNKNAGTATVLVAGKGNYSGTAKATFKIAKAKNTMTAKVKSKTLKAKKLMAKEVSLKKMITVKKAKGTVSYKKASTAKKLKQFKVNSKNGAITVPKGAKKGVYKVKVKVTAKGNANYKRGSKTVTVKITVK